MSKRCNQKILFLLNSWQKLLKNVVGENYLVLTYRKFNWCNFQKFNDLFFKFINQYKKNNLGAPPPNINMQVVALYSQSILCLTCMNLVQIIKLFYVYSLASSLFVKSLIFSKLYHCFVFNDELCNQLENCNEIYPLQSLMAIID